MPRDQDFIKKGQLNSGEKESGAFQNIPTQGHHPVLLPNIWGVP